MSSLPLHQFHTLSGAIFGEINSQQTVLSYGSVESEYRELVSGAALLDLSFRGRICVLGAEREKFLHGQVTNEVLKLKQGEGCYAFLVNGKGKIQSDLRIYKLKEELLLDFEPGLTNQNIERLEKYIIAEDVQVVDVAQHYSLLSIQGPKADGAVMGCGLFHELPENKYSWISVPSAEGEIYLAKNPRLKSNGYDLFAPLGATERIARSFQTPWAGWNAFEMARIEAGIPRYGIDFTEVNLPQETELQDEAVSFSKGCYIGQEVIARIRTYGQVAKALRLLRLANETQNAVEAGSKLFNGGREVGYITSSGLSPKYGAEVGLGYVRKECNEPGTKLQLSRADGPEVIVVGIPGKEGS
jgi:folate-binding protein YgfZ